MHRSTITAAACAAFALTPPLLAQSWSRFRGPDGGGIRTDAELPAKLDEESIVWTVPVGGTGHSSPVLWDDLVLLTRAKEGGAKRGIVAFSAKDGSEAWSYDEDFVPAPQHRLNSSAAATPAVDETGVYVAWTSKEGVSATALGLKGEHRWTRKVGTFAAQHGGGNSAVLLDDLLIVANENEGETSFLMALDRATGATRWTIDRDSTDRRASYACPIVLRHADEPALLLFCSTAHGLAAVDPASGELRWQLDLEFGQRFVGVPAIANGHVILSAGSGGGGKEAAVVRLPEGDEDAQIAYRPRRNLPYVPGHIALSDRFYLISDGGIATCMDAASGEVAWSERLDGTFFSSPVSDGKTLWIASREGRLFSLALGETFETRSSLDLGSPILATPALGQKRMFVRTAEHLVCLR